MAHSGLKTAGRVVLAIGGGYWAASASFSLLALLLTGCGLPRVDAATLCMMVAFIVYLCLILWVFAARALWRPLGAFSFLILAGYVFSALHTQGH